MKKFDAAAILPRNRLRVFLNHSLRYLFRALVVALPLGIALLESMNIVELPLATKIESMIYDVRLKAFMPRTLDDRIVIVDIDEKSLAELGHWPWSRDHMAALVDRLFDDQGIVALGIDIVFAEPDDRSGLGQLRTLARGSLRDHNDFLQELARLEPLLDYDQRFANALRGRPVVLGYYLSSDRDGHRSGVLPEPVLTGEMLEDFGLQHFSATEWNGYGSNIPVIAEAGALAGFFNPVVDADGMVRALPLLARLDDNYYESLSLAVYRLLHDLPEVFPGFPPDSFTLAGYPSLESLLLEHADGRVEEIRVDERLAVLIPYRGPGGVQGGSFRYYSAADIILGRLEPGLLQGRIAFLGTTAPGLLDLRATPVGETYPGVEANANVLSGLLDGLLPVIPDYATGYELLVLVATAALLALMLPWLGALAALTTIALTLTVLVTTNLWFFSEYALVLPLATPLLMVLLIYGLHITYSHLVESRSKRKLAELFGSYVPPELVEEMLKEPEHYDMRAVDRELTVMFSDMRGFTNLSESMEPHALQDLLNRIFSRLSAIIRSERGTIDKFMGDCVMAFWGAPISTPDHARLATRAALSMRTAIDQINEENRAAGLPAIGMGIGMNTGVMCVGDMGSYLRRSYTVIGDAVNLGSRLEGLGKVYGVDIVASGFTRAQVDTGFLWQEMDRVIVKGKEEAVTIYTLRGTDTDAESGLRQELDAWDRCLGAYRNQDWNTAERCLETLLLMAPECKLYTLYMERVQGFLRLPPEPDWDGSTRFDTK